MAQREKEETEQLKVPETALTIRPPNCALDPAAVHGSTSPKARSPTETPRGRAASPARRRGVAPEAPAAAAAAAAAAAGPGAKRCEGCRRKVGLMGFRCRCGGVFCAEHRYSDRHACSFDYKAAAREEIARANPVVKAAKIVRI